MLIAATKLFWSKRHRRHPISTIRSFFTDAVFPDPSPPHCLIRTFHSNFQALVRYLDWESYLRPFCWKWIRSAPVVACMSGARSDPAPGDRYRPGDLVWAGKDKDSLESWNWTKDSTMTTPSRTVSAPSPDASRKNENISISQRMVSATCGSILTNLLGKGIASCDLAQMSLHG